MHDDEINELLKKFLMLAALAKDDSPSDPLPIFSSPSPIVTQTENKASVSESRFPSIRAKLAKIETQSEEPSSAE